jgi:hypothetical protein
MKIHRIINITMNYCIINEIQRLTYIIYQVFVYKVNELVFC